ncbi:MAG TPA: hypothetical protein PKY78_06095 [Candidatus Omnitrophota bacterium]|mgnify:CR=1 FL=1|nr:hypothetical protein [Candidatus Omnitrophota bacterium]
MLSKADYKSYFEQVAVLERSMVCETHDIIAASDDEFVIETAKSVLRDELKHYKLVQMVLGTYIYESLEERKSFARKSSIGDVTVLFPDGSSEKGRCIFLSDERMIAEFDMPVKVCPEKVKISMIPYDGGAGIDSLVLNIWTEMIGAEFSDKPSLKYYLAGFEF